MRVDILPDKKYEAQGGKERLSVRIILHVDTETKAEVQELRERWDKLQEDGSVKALVDLIKEMNARPSPGVR